MHNNYAVQKADLIINSSKLARNFRWPCEKSKRR